MPTWILSVWTFLKKVPAWVWGLVVVGFFLLATGQWVKRERKKAFEQGEKKAETHAAVESAKAETAVVETIRQIEEDTQDEADEAIAARDDALHNPVDPDSLPDATKSRIFKDA